MTAETWWDRHDETTLEAAFTGSAGGDVVIDGVVLPARVFRTDAGARVYLRGEIAWRGLGSVVDLGCGPGQEWAGLAEEGIAVRYVGVDRTVPMLNIARRRFPRVPFVRALIDQLPFADRAFDVVYTRHTLEHEPHYTRTLREMCRVASKLVVISFFRCAVDGPDQIVEDDGRWENRYNLGRVAEEAQRLGFKYVEAVSFPVSWDTVMLLERAGG